VTSICLTAKGGAPAAAMLMSTAAMFQLFQKESVRSGPRLQVQVDVSPLDSMV
jgi:hypothetical protein